ncbi:unnamed protein product [Lactuca saligna]|uniref:PB1-like domain-containing protein n=1 Tax=Lactuca saligna TaxID=75948 RepID=A0AA35V888_LACSI|nr:unnamed protein product [Lactuca saligna]
MAQSGPNGLFAMVELNYQGVFNRNPFSYTGGVKTIFNDVDFSSITYSEFVTFCERFMHEECKKFYYCEPDMSFMEGLNPISDDVEYSAFIFDAYGTDGVISVYVDHIRVGVDGWHDDEDNDDNEHESCIDGENEDNIDELRNVAFEFNEDVVHMNRTSNDPFLSKLCVDDEDANNIVNDDNGREVEVNIQAHSIFNELLHWKKQKPILGMRFKGPGAQQHEDVEMTPIEMDTTQNDMQVAPTDVESSSVGDFIQYVQFTPLRSYEGDEGVMGEEADVVEEAVVVEQFVQDEEAEEVDPVIQVDNVNVQEVDEVNHNAQVDNGNVQEVASVNQVRHVCVRPISYILKMIRRRKSERILKLKLGKTIGGVDDPGISKGKALVID